MLETYFPTTFFSMKLNDFLYFIKNSPYLSSYEDGTHKFRICSKFRTIFDKFHRIWTKLNAVRAKTVYARTRVRGGSGVGPGWVAGGSRVGHGQAYGGSRAGWVTARGPSGKKKSVRGQPSIPSRPGSFMTPFGVPLSLIYKNDVKTTSIYIYLCLHEIVVCTHI